MADTEAPDRSTPERFADLLRRLVRVPKAEIDEKEREYRESTERGNPVKAGEMLARRPGPKP
jgi:hypothetical protein